MSLTLGISSGACYPQVATEQFPSQAAAFGFGVIELMLQTTGEYDESFLRAIRSDADARGVAVHAMHLFQPLHPLFSPYQRRTDDAVELFRRGVEGAAHLGASLVVWHGPTRRELAAGATWPQFLDMTDRLAGMAAESGLVLGIENVSWCVIAAVRDAIRLAASLQSLANGRHVGFVFDSFQALEAGANHFMMLAAMEGRIANVHLSDGIEGDETQRHLLPGDGEIPWPALIKAIDGAGYTGPMMLEATVAGLHDIERVRTLIDPLISDIERADADCDRPLPAGVRRGIDLFNLGEFYEAHEVIEHEWHAERGEVRALYQGILQIGVGLHHLRSGNYRGAELLLTDGIEKVSRFLPVCQSVDTEDLVLHARVCLKQLESLGPDHMSEFDWDLAPQIQMG